MVDGCRGGEGTWALSIQRVDTQLIDRAHPDLRDVRTPTAREDAVSEHATMVAGALGAIWDNGLGVEGTYSLGHSTFQREIDWESELDVYLFDILANEPSVRVLNMSVGYTIGRDPCGLDFDPVTTEAVPGLTWADVIKNQGDHLRGEIAKWTFDRHREDFILFCSAPNQYYRPDTDPARDYLAELSGSCQNLGARNNGRGLTNHFIAVEATDPFGERAYFSATGGTVSAPGQCIRSTEVDDGFNYDAMPDECTTVDDGTAAESRRYATASGTSFASPYAAGVAAYLWTLAPDLSYQDVYELLTHPDYTREIRNNSNKPAADPPRTPSRQIDGFAAAMGIDSLPRHDPNLANELQRALVDVDDGTPDGNKRSTFTQGQAPQDYASIDTADKRRGDGVVGMSDFRAFRDAVVQVLLENGTLKRDAVSLNGAASHIKKDLNGDGCVGGQPVTPPHPSRPAPADCSKAPPENVFPRFDFNGNGAIDATRVSFKGENRSDLDVLRDLWDETDAATQGWSSDALASLLPPPVGTGGSADIEMVLDPALVDAGVAQVEVTLVGHTTVPVVLDASGPPVVFTVPALSPVSFRLNAHDAAGERVPGVCTGRSPPAPQLNHGQDVTAQVSWCPEEWALRFRVNGCTLTRFQCAPREPLPECGCPPESTIRGFCPAGEWNVSTFSVTYSGAALASPDYSIDGPYVAAYELRDSHTQITGQQTEGEISFTLPVQGNITAPLLDPIFQPPGRLEAEFTSPAAQPLVGGYRGGFTYYLESRTAADSCTDLTYREEGQGTVEITVVDED